MTKNQSLSNCSDQGEDEAAKSHTLLGKVLLLIGIGNDVSTLQTLVKLIAKKGADVALVCNKLPLDILLGLKESVQSVDKQILVIDETELLEGSKGRVQASEKLVEIIVDKFGNLDAFIDLSAAKKEPLLKNRNDSSWYLQMAILNQL